jgi:hypothetical protein
MKGLCDRSSASTGWTYLEFSVGGVAAAMMTIKNSDFFRLGAR